MNAEFHITIEGAEESEYVVPAPLGLVVPLLRDMADQFAERARADGYIAVPIPREADITRDEVAAMFDKLRAGIAVGSVASIDGKCAEFFGVNDTIAYGVRDALLSQGTICAYQFARENGFWGKNACMYAAASGHLECLKYAHENGCPWDTEVCENAALGRNPDCLRYAHENGCPLGSDLCDVAATVGSFACLQYAHEHGCPVGEATCTLAAMCGSIDCMRYAHEHGAPLDDMTHSMIARRADQDCLRYARENGCVELSDWCGKAARDGNLTKLQFAHESGFPWRENVCHLAARGGHLACLRYAHENGCPWDKEAILRLAQLDPDCARYVREH